MTRHVERGDTDVARSERGRHGVVRQRARELNARRAGGCLANRCPFRSSANQDGADIVHSLPAQQRDGAHEVNGTVPRAERARKDGHGARRPLEWYGTGSPRTEAIGVGAPFDLEHAV
jgi:hypothetical protein